MMSEQNFIYAVFVMCGVMVAVKVIPILFCKEKIKNTFIKSFLEYIPFAVLTSMIIPEIFHSTSSVISAVIGFIAAIILAYVGQSLVVVALSTTFIVFIAEQIMQWCR